MDDDALDDLLRSAVRSASVAATGPHPEPDTLLRYQADELPESEHEALQQHLVDCRACRRLVLDLAACLQLEAAESEALDADEQRADWRRLVAELARRRRGGAPARLRPDLRLRRLAGWPAASLGVAASVLLAFWFGWSSARAPVGDVQIADVGRVQTRQREAGQVGRTSVVVAAHSRRLVLLFHTGDDALFSREARAPRSPASRYRLELRRREGQRATPVWSGDLTADEEGNLSLALTSRGLPSGAYEGWIASAGAALEPAYEFELEWK